MISGNEEQIALVITGREQGAVAAARGVGSAIDDTAKRAVAASATTKLSATQAADALKQMGIAARVDAAGGLSRVVVAASELDKAKTSLAAFGASADLAAAAVDKTASASEKAAAREAAAAERRVQTMGKLELAAYAEAEAREQAVAREIAAAERAAAKEVTTAERRIAEMGKLEAAAYKEAESRVAASEREAAAAARTAERELVADERRIAEMGKLEVAAYKEAAAMERAADRERAAAEAITPIDSKARSAANGMAVLSLAMVTGSGSAQSLALAAGLASSSILALSKNAKIAASANGVGALITLLGVYYETVQKIDQADPVSAAFTDRLNGQGLAAARGNLASLKQERDNLLATLDNIGPNDRVARLKDIETLNEEIVLADKRVLTLRADAAKEAREKEKAEVQKALREREAADKASAEREKSGRAELGKLKDAESAEIAKRTLNPEAAAKLAAERERATRDEAIRELQITEQLKGELLTASAHLRNEQIAAIDKEARDKELHEALGNIDKLNKASAAANKQKSATVRGYVDEIVTAERLGARQLAGIALRPIISYLEAKATSEAIDAYGSLGVGNFLGAAGHAAYAAAAIAGARKLAGIAGGGGGGGGGGAPSGGGYGGATDGFTPRASGTGGGNVTVILNSIDPTAPGVISKTRYELNRADVLNKPIPTGGGGSIHLQVS